MSIGGNYIQEPGGTLQIELGGVDWHDILQFEGEAQLLGGDVFISFWDNLAPQDGMSFDFLHAEKGGRGEFESVYGSDDWIWELAYMDIDTSIPWREVVQLTARSVSSPVPEPTTCSLLGLGILALAGMRRNRFRTGES